MKQLLFVSYAYPPCRSPSAAVRSAKFVKYLPRFGWQPTIVCCRERDITGQEQDDDSIIRLSSLVSTRLSYQLTTWGWAPSVLRIAPRLRDRCFDALYVSCPPFPHGLAALRLKKKLELPLVVDLRDAWALDPFEATGAIKRLAKQGLCTWVYPPLEGRLLRNADAIIVTTPSMEREYRRVFGVDPNRITVIPNGYDEEDFSKDLPRVPRGEDHARPVFVYCGSLTGQAARSPDLILRGLRGLLEAGKGIELRVVGGDSALLRRRVGAFGLEDHVSLTPPVPHEQAIADKHGVRLSLFVDVGYLRRLRHEARSHAELGVEHNAICRQLERAVSGGHEIQLHVHPHWEDASYDGFRWLMPLERYRLQDFSDDDIASIVRADSDAIANIAGVRPRAYRAGGWCVQPFDRLAKPLQSIGVEIDSTVYPGGRSVSPGREYDFRAAPTDSYWRFETDPLVPTENGRFIELPITPLTTYPLFYWRLVARAVSRRDRTLGDGVAVSKGARYYLSRLFSPTRCCASIDGEKARLTRQAFRGAQSTGGQVLNLVGHPKSQSKRSLELLDRFLAEHREHLEPSRFQDFELEDAARTDGVAHADGVQA